MINCCLLWLIRIMLWLRYRIDVKGLDTIRDKGTHGILFLPNHPALIDPLIMVSRLYGPFKVRALGDAHQIDRFIIRSLAKRINVLPIADLSTSGASSVDQVRVTIDRCVEALRQQENLVLYPAGRIYRSHLEEVGANSGVESILKALPEIRVVLVRTKGLWGCSTSWAHGHAPKLQPALIHAVKSLLLNVIFFTPRRSISIELVEPDDLPRQADRKTLNDYLESFYNQADAPNTYVPYTLWEGGGIQVRPEPQFNTLRDSDRKISSVIRQQVQQYIQEVTDITSLSDDLSLSRDLGLDSLALVDLITWLEQEYGHSQIDPDSLMTVSDVYWAAAGEAISAGEKGLEAVPPKWFKTSVSPLRPDTLSEMTFTEAFLYQARRDPGRVIVADQLSGAKTYRDMILAIMLLRNEFLQLPGEVLGIMLPASVGVSIVYLAALFAGKIPVMVNWTLGRRNLLHALDSLEVAHIVTAEALLTKIRAQGIHLDDIETRFLTLESIRTRLTPGAKLRALIKARFSWTDLTHVTVPDTAVVLFTSGSENVPKAVPLTHRNIMTNVSDIFECFKLYETDTILGILPPFHSFGLTGSMALSLCLGIRTVYYPNPTHGGTLAGMIEGYTVSILIGTPTFLEGILRTASKEQLSSLRLVASGAEKCPQRVYDRVAELCPQSTILEAYGVTECSPCISINHEDNPHRETIGKIMRSLDHVIVHNETGQRVGVGQKGVLLVRGDSVFAGYLNYDGPSPFVEFDGKQWYRTGDLVEEDAQGILTFRGRLKRFIKLGGEMIALPAIETVLLQHFADLSSEEGPLLAVVATPVEENPDVVLVSTVDIDRVSANTALREAGLSGLHNIRQVIHRDAIPLLGTGKIDYKTLEAELKTE